MADRAVSARIFICYRRADASGTAGRLYDRLRGRFGKAEVFLDTSMHPGDVFTTEIQSALDSCQVLLALIGPNWLTAVDEAGQPRLRDPDDQLVREIRTVLNRGGRVVPVLLDGARLPAAAELPEELSGMTRHQTFTVDQASFDRDVRELTAELDRILGVSRWRRPALVSVIVVALVGVVALLLRGQASPTEPGGTVAGTTTPTATPIAAPASTASGPSGTSAPPPPANSSCRPAASRTGRRPSSPRSRASSSAA